MTRTARVVTVGPTTGAVHASWIALHGYGQLALRFAGRFGVLDDGTQLIVVPEGLSRCYQGRSARVVGASWMTREDREAEIADYIGYLDQVAAWLPGAAQAAPRTVLGFSQGAATAWRWVTLGAAPPPARLVIWGGEIPDDLDLAVAARRLGNAEVVFVAGDRDRYCPPTRAAALADQASRAGMRCEVRAYSGGHDLDAAVLTALAGGLR